MAENQTRLAVLIFTDLVGSTGLKTQHGAAAYAAALRRHNQLFESNAARFAGLRVVKHTGDGYFAVGEKVADAVAFALCFQDAMRSEVWGAVPLVTRVGIHAGEVTVMETLGQQDVIGLAADVAARVMSLALGGQILLTRFPFDEARQHLCEHPSVARGPAPALVWMAHGPYRFKGADEPMEVFEVGADGFAPLTAPPDSEKARRAVRPGEEETLGWRPAIGLEIPVRPGWQLERALGAGGFGEVWLATHAKLRERRVFKFCFDDERLRALKREVTLVRLLRDVLGDRDDIVRLHDLRLDAPPFFLESEFAEDGNLEQWAARQPGGLAEVVLAKRLQLVARIAIALAAAHSVGVLHKDLKPANVLIVTGEDGEPRPRLVDFGIGALADKSVLEGRHITLAGFTVPTLDRTGSSGTPLYSPPELLAGKPFTMQGDLYALGVVLYQMVVADLHRPLAPGWERDVSDPILRADIAACVDGDPARRIASAAEIATRLQTLEARRAESERETAAAAAAARERETRESFCRVRRLAIAFGIIGLLACAAAWMASHQKQKADLARKRAEMMVEYAQSDLRQKLENIGRVDVLLDLSDKVVEYVNALLDDGETDDALRMKDVALEQRADILSASGREREALDVRAERLGIAERERTSAPNHDLTLVSCYCCVARSQVTLGQFSEAIATSRRAVAVAERLSKREKPTAVELDEVGGAFDTLAFALQESGAKAESLEPRRRCVAIMKECAALEPDNGVFHDHLAQSFRHLGATLRELHQFAEAEVLARKGVAAAEATTGKGREADNRHALMAAYGQLGEVFLDESRFQEADEVFRKSLAAIEPLAAKDTHNVRFQLDLAKTLIRLGRAEKTLGHGGDVTFRRALEILSAQEKAAPENAWVKTLRAEVEAATK